MSEHGLDLFHFATTLVTQNHLIILSEKLVSQYLLFSAHFLGGSYKKWRTRKIGCWFFGATLVVHIIGVYISFHVAWH